jgi:transposase-like protein
MEQKICIYCNKKLYKLSNGMVKCSSCAKKYSLLKLQRDLNVIDAFIESSTARECAIKLNLSYQVVLNRYEHLRKLIARHSHDYYEDKRDNLDEFEEYMYICKSKKKDYTSIIESQNFITFAHEDKVYNFLLPSLKKFQTKPDENRSEAIHANEFKKFMITSHISKLKNIENIITKFWDFFEDFITPYKGVKSEYFLGYLKEAEFKFNYTTQEQKEILVRLWKNG